MRECEHTGIPRALVKYPAEHPEGTWRSSGPRPRRTPLDAPKRTTPRATWWLNCTTHKRYTTRHNYMPSDTPRDISYATWHKRSATWHKLCYRHKLCYVTYDLCCVHCTIQHKICQHKHRRGNTHASSGNIFTQTPFWEACDKTLDLLGSDPNDERVKGRSNKLLLTGC